MPDDSDDLDHLHDDSQVIISNTAGSFFEFLKRQSGFTSKAANILSSHDTRNSQVEQDQIIVELMRGRRQGYFIDLAGADAGVCIWISRERQRETINFPKGRVNFSFNTMTAWEQSAHMAPPACKTSGDKDRVRTGDRRHPVLYLCQLGQDTPFPNSGGGFRHDVGSES